MEVALYIKTPKFQNANAITLSSFMSRVRADGGVFEAANCCADIIESLGSSFDTLETYNRIELFDDEKISVTSSIQNINDISKVFTDYSQSFTIPASKNNNEIFKYWYENSIDDGFNQLKRYPGYIEIDTQTFRSGRWQLESASVNGNRIEDYKITFYGELKSLSDKFKEDKLRDLNTVNDFTIEYTGANVQTAITSSSEFDVTFPLVSSDRVWEYGGGGANDISVSATRMDYTELFPAVKLPRIFDAIESRYGVSFNGNFLTQSRFNSAYLWLKNSEAVSLVAQTEAQLITMADFVQDRLYYISDNYFTPISFEDGQFLTDMYFELLIDFGVSRNSTLTVYRDGQLYTTINNVGQTTGFRVDSTIGFGQFSFWIQTTVPTSYTYNYSTYIYEYDPVGASGYINLQSENGSGTLTQNLDLTRYMPDIKVTDFFSGILKMFNLTAFSEDGVNFTLEQLENWYYQGEIRDYSGYCVTDFDYSRIKPYKKLNFEYEKSESVLNRYFANTNGREYGNLSYPFDNDGTDYTIKLPFENIMFNRFSGTFLQVAYAVKPDLIKYEPKPIILYNYENRACSFYLNNGTSTDLITNYKVFGQDVKYQSQTHSLNWGAELSSYLLSVVNNGLFSDYYLSYFNNLYSIRSRMVKVKMRLPYSELLNLKLNDRIVIRDKRYIINQFTTDLTTFESDFELIQDFRSINYNNGRVQTTDNTLKTLRFNTLSAEPLTWTIESDPDGLITSLIDGDSYVDIVVKDNITGLQRTAGVISNLNDRIIIIQDA